MGDMPASTNITTLRFFLGLVNYRQSFVPNMRCIPKLLDDHLQNSEWKWSTLSTSIQNIKGLLNSDPLLTHYDPSLEVIVTADALEHGLGAVIQHRWPDRSVRAIARASCSNKPAEQNYSQIEKEGLALIFAVKKFNKYIYGLHFTLLTDHRPLLPIFGNRKGIPVHSVNRLHRWAATLHGYDFRIEYRKSAEFGQSDALSHLISSHSAPDENVVFAAVQAEFKLYVLTSYFLVTFDKLHSMTEMDALLQSVKKFTKSRWSDLRLLRQHRESLTIEKGCILLWERVVIQTALRTKVL
jgi:hypothetical protein